MTIIEKDLMINNKRGLHARAAAKLVEICSQFNSNATFNFKQRTAPGNSLIRLLMLGAVKGDIIHANIKGHDAEKMLVALETLLTNNFDEEE